MKDIFNIVLFLIFFDPLRHFVKNVRVPLCVILCIRHPDKRVIAFRRYLILHDDIHFEFFTTSAAETAA